jgi:hypothetical protein
MKFLYILICCLLVGCSASQFTYYKPSDIEPKWRINVEKRGISNEFVCTINDSIVVRDNFGFLNNNFEKDGMYQGKRIKMSGYSKSFSTTGPNGQGATNTTYQIRVFVDEKEVASFSF